MLMESTKNKNYCEEVSYSLKIFQINDYRDKSISNETCAIIHLCFNRTDRSYQLIGFNVCKLLGIFKSSYLPQ